MSPTPILDAVSETPQPRPDDASTPDGAPPSPDASPSADDRPGSRGGRIVAVLLVSLLVGAGTFVLMAIGQAF